MENLRCLVCLQPARRPRACPKCAKMFCNPCITRDYATNNRQSCPHCRHSLGLNDYVKQDFLDDLREERAKELDKCRKDQAVLETKLRQAMSDAKLLQIDVKLLRAEKTKLDDKVASMIRLTADRCDTHPNKEKALFCNECDKSYCHECRHDHPINLVEDAYQSAVATLQDAKKVGVEMQKILDEGQPKHELVVQALREECEQKIVQVGHAMRAAHEIEIHRASSLLEDCLKNLQSFQSKYKQELADATKAQESSMLNRLADKKSSLEDCVKDATDIVNNVRRVPAFINISNGLPSISVNTHQVLKPWIQASMEIVGGREGEEEGASRDTPDSEDDGKEVNDEQDAENPFSFVYDGEQREDISFGYGFPQGNQNALVRTEMVKGKVNERKKEAERAEEVRRARSGGRKGALGGRKLYRFGSRSWSE